MSIYQNLDGLLARDSRAREYFNKLPNYAQDSMRERANNIHTWPDLQTYAENLLTGDD